MYASVAYNVANETVVPYFVDTLLPAAVDRVLSDQTRYTDSLLPDSRFFAQITQKVADFLSEKSMSKIGRIYKILAEFCQYFWGFFQIKNHFVN